MSASEDVSIFFSSFHPYRVPNGIDAEEQEQQEEERRVSLQVRVQIIMIPSSDWRSHGDR